MCHSTAIINYISHRRYLPNRAPYANATWYYSCPVSSGEEIMARHGSHISACTNARMLACTIIMAHMPQCVYTCVLKYMYACGHVSTHMHESMNACTHAHTHMHKHAAYYTSMQCPPTSNVAPTSAAVFDGGLRMGIERGEGSSRCGEWMGG